MKGYIANIEKLSLENENLEIHQLDQFIKCEAGMGKAILDGVEHDISDGFVVVVQGWHKT